MKATGGAVRCGCLAAALAAVIACGSEDSSGAGGSDSTSSSGGDGGAQDGGGGAGGEGAGGAGGNGGAGGGGGEAQTYAHGLDGSAITLAPLADGGVVAITGGFTVRVRRFDENGVMLWEQAWADPFQGATEVTPYAAVASADRVYFTGLHDGEPHPLGPIAIPPTEGRCPFLVGLDPADGTPEIAQQWCEGSSFSGSDNAGFGLDVAPNGDLWMLVYASAPIDFGGGELPPPPNSGLVAVRLDADGNHLLSVGFGGPDMTFGWPASNLPFERALRATADGGFVMAGEAGESADVGGGVLGGPTFSSRGFVARFDESGDHLWSRGIGNNGEPSASSFPASMDLAADGDVLLAVRAGNGQSVTLDGQTFDGLGLLRLDGGTGAAEYAQSFDAAHPSSVVALGDHAAIAGRTPAGQPVDFGAGPIEGGFVAVFDSQGTPVTSTACPASVERLAQDAAGRLVLAFEEDVMELFGESIASACADCDNLVIAIDPIP